MCWPWLSDTARSATGADLDDLGFAMDGCCSPRGRLARAPKDITVGEVVRFTEPDMDIVQCHEFGHENSCAAWRVCNLTRGFRRALAAFMRELDEITMEDAVTVPRFAASVLGLTAAGRQFIPLGVAAGAGKTPAKPAPVAPRTHGGSAARRPVTRK